MIGNCNWKNLLHLHIGIIASVLLLSSCTDSTKNYHSSENEFLNNSKFAPEERTFKAEPELVNYIPADSSQIARVRNSNDKYKIEYGFSFGECIGFCQVKKEFSSAGMITTSTR